MSIYQLIVRQVMLAALIALPILAWADVTAQFEATSGEIIVSDLTKETRDRLLNNKDSIRLTVKGQASTRSMPLTLREENRLLAIKPRFSLRAGTSYLLEVGDEQFEITSGTFYSSAPELDSFAPSQSIIPANILRLYLNFSEPMARGQLRDVVKLVRDDDSTVENPFLNLETELWDHDQRRATILFDPGRVKQGVGPNRTKGAPLQAGQGYKLIISGLMKSAAGAPLSQSAVVSFRVGAAERRAINPKDWQVLEPPAETYSPFSVAFDRIMDSGAVLRLLSLEAPDGSRVEGEIMTDGGGWSITPKTPWVQGRYRLIVHPELEDVSGNTPGVPFDAGAGTIGSKQKPTSLTFHISG